MDKFNRQDGTKMWYQLPRSPQPKASLGACKNYRYGGRINNKHCDSFWAVLGEGYCVECWDRGKGGNRWKKY